MTESLTPPDKDSGTLKACGCGWPSNDCPTSVYNCPFKRTPSHERDSDVDTLRLLLHGFNDDTPIKEVRAMLDRQFGSAPSTTPQNGDTPRTDAVWPDSQRWKGDKRFEESCNLERELARVEALHKGLMAEADRRVEVAEGELAEALFERGNAIKTANELDAEVSRLKALSATDALDAKRYRSLRARCYVKDMGVEDWRVVLSFQAHICINDVLKRLADEKYLDAAIDADLARADGTTKEKS